LSKLSRSESGFRLVDLLTGPHGVDRYTELVAPLGRRRGRAKVIDVRRTTPRSVTLTSLERAFASAHTVKAVSTSTSPWTSTAAGTPVLFTCQRRK